MPPTMAMIGPIQNNSLATKVVRSVAVNHCQHIHSPPKNRAFVLLLRHCLSVKMSNHTRKLGFPPARQGHSVKSAVGKENSGIGLVHDVPFLCAGRASGRERWANQR